MFDPITGTGVLFNYTVGNPDRSAMQVDNFQINSPCRETANALSVNVASVAVIGKSVE